MQVLLAPLLALAPTLQDHQVADQDPGGDVRAVVLRALSPAEARGVVGVPTGDVLDHAHRQALDGSWNAFEGCRGPVEATSIAVSALALEVYCRYERVR
jgi:hypothetical protein